MSRPNSPNYDELLCQGHLAPTYFFQALSKCLGRGEAGCIPSTWERQQKTWRKAGFLMTGILLPFSLGAEMLPQLLPILACRFVQSRLHAIRSSNDEVSERCIEGFGICTLTGVACVSRTCELMTLFITHLTISLSHPAWCLRQLLILLTSSYGRK